MGSARIDMTTGNAGSRNWTPKRRTQQANDYGDQDGRYAEAYSRKEKYQSWKRVDVSDEIDDDFPDDRDEYR